MENWRCGACGTKAIDDECPICKNNVGLGDLVTPLSGYGAGRVFTVCYVYPFNEDVRLQYTDGAEHGQILEKFGQNEIRRVTLSDNKRDISQPIRV